MSVLKYFKNIPRSPPIGRQALSVIFFFKFATRSLKKKEEKKGGCRPPNGRQGPVAHPRGDRALSPVGQATGSPCAVPPLLTPSGRRVERRSRNEDIHGCMESS